jgi:hypothetical protein
LGVAEGGSNLSQDTAGMCWWVAQVGGTPHVAPAAPAETPGMRCQSSGSAWDNGVWPFHQDVQKGTAR